MRRSLRAGAFVGGLAIACLLLAAPAQGTHPRPKAATPFKVPLVPAYSACAAPNRTHGPPLAFASCSPPAQASSYLTVGTPDANGAAARSAGFLRFDVVDDPDEAIAIQLQITDVRCTPAMTSACGSANTTGGPDYVGGLQANMTARLTDHDNATEPGGGTDAATMVDIPNPIGFSCAATADPSIGGSCKWTQQCTMPRCTGVTTGDRTVIALAQVRVMDGGPDGVVGTADNTLFAAQGLFVP